MHTAKDAVRSRYVGEAGHDYHARVHASTPSVAEVVARQRVRKFLPFIGPNDTVLEYGVGTGLNLRYLSCRRRIGYDVSDAGRAACEQAGIDFTSDLSTVRGEVSVVICHHVLEHLPDPLQSLEEMKRVLGPGGRLILCVPYETMGKYRRFVAGDRNHHLFSWNALTLGNLVEAAGFAVESARISPFGYEQRLAGLAQHVGAGAYRVGLAIVRTLRPADEVFLLATRS
jgi:SAM-dependent methyltransferase